LVAAVKVGDTSWEEESVASIIMIRYLFPTVGKQGEKQKKKKKKKQ